MFSASIGICPLNSSNFLPIFQGRSYFMPKREIYKTAWTPLKWNLVFMMFARRTFSSGMRIVNCTCSCPKNHFFQQNSESTVTLIQKKNASTQPLFPKRQTVKPWSTITRWSAIIFWYAKKMNMYGSLRPSQEALHCYTIHKSFSHTIFFPTLPHRPCWSAKNGKTRRRMARERRGAGSSLVSMETPYYKTIY